MSVNKNTNTGIEVIRIFPFNKYNIVSLQFPPHTTPKIGTHIITQEGRSLKISAVAFNISLGKDIWDCVLDGDIDALMLNQILYSID